MHSSDRYFPIGNLRREKIAQDLFFYSGSANLRSGGVRVNICQAAPKRFRFVTTAAVPPPARWPR
ncbi:MAG: hypothetical protein M5R36_22040 [Deltaproteobacteria bacterium]|nr:hypothetical protein [Deltaproteobacteria bacterium]